MLRPRSHPPGRRAAQQSNELTSLIHDDATRQSDDLGQGNGDCCIAIASSKVGHGMCGSMVAVTRNPQAFPKSTKLFLCVRMSRASETMRSMMVAAGGTSLMRPAACPAITAATSKLPSAFAEL